VIAVVNGHNITRGELEESLSGMASMVDGGKPKLESFPKDFQRNFIDKYIDKQLIIEAARKAGMHKSPEIVEKVTVAENYLAHQKYLSEIVLKQKTDKKLKALYNEIISDKDSKEEVHASHILVKTEKEALDIKAQLEKGEDLAKLAKEKSIEPGAKVSAGDLGYFTKSQMVPEFSEAAFALKKDEISAPIKSSFGWHIIKAHDKREKKAPSYKESLPALEQEFARRIIVEEADKLKKKAKIEYKIDLEPEKKEEAKPEPKKAEKKEVKKEEPKKAEKKLTEEKTKEKTEEKKKDGN